MSERVPVASLPEATAWVVRQLGLVGHDSTVSREHLRTLGEYLVRFGNPAAESNVKPAKASSTRTRTRTKPTKAEVRTALTRRIAERLETHPGSTYMEMATALHESVEAVTHAARPVNYLILEEDEVAEPAERRESAATAATRDRARAALLASSLMTQPLSHQAYTTLLREGRVKGPSVARIVQLFGSWTVACNSVGVSSGEPLRQNYERTWTHDDLLNYVARFLREPQFRGASHQFDVWRATVNTGEKVPSLGTVRNIVGGTWNDIRTATLRHMRKEWA